MTRGVVLVLTLCLFVPAAAAFEILRGPSFTNGTAAPFLLHMTFANGRTDSLNLQPGASYVYWEGQQVTVIDVQMNAGRRITWAGATLPSVPDDLARPMKQNWLITDNAICLLANRYFNLARTPNCGAAGTAGTVSPPAK